MKTSDLEDILESISKIEEYTKEVTEDAFLQDSQVQDAVLRRLEVMGEAAKKWADDKFSAQRMVKKIMDLYLAAKRDE